MAEETVAVDINATPDVLWGMLGDFEGIGGFFPGIESVVIEEDDRVLNLAGMEIRERLISRDDESSTLVYSIVDGVPVEFHKATITVVPRGEHSTVTWKIECEPAEMLPVFASTYTTALEGLKKRFS
jgi:carbon monoxide dehydrogenase subunit G